MKIVIEFESNNDAFQDDIFCGGYPKFFWEVFRILQHCSNVIGDHRNKFGLQLDTVNKGLEYGLKDENGNTIGKLKIEV